MTHEDTPESPLPPPPAPPAPPSDDSPFESANRHHFDAAAETYDEHPNAQRVAALIGRAMIDTGLFTPATIVMDFACGTGLVSRVLAAEDPASIVGVDISQGMVDRYNQIVSDHGIPPGEMRAVCVPPYERLQGLTFDVIVCAIAYHHLPSIDETTAMLVSTYLKLGGSLLVTDIARGESQQEVFPEHSHHIVPHKKGFAETDIRSTFEKAGLKNITFDIVTHVTHNGHPVDLFLARGDK